MDDRAARIYHLMHGGYNLSKVDFEEAKVVKNEFLTDEHCRMESERGLAARIRILDRWNDGNDDDDVDIMVDSHYEIEEHLARKMYDYAVYFQRQDYIRDIFHLVRHHRQFMENCDDLSVKTIYEYEAAGLMAAAMLILQMDLDKVEELYNAYKENETNPVYPFGHM